MHDYVLAKLEAHKGHWPAIAQAAGVPYRTVQKIAQRLIADPGVGHIQKLHDHFRAQESEAAA